MRRFLIFLCILPLVIIISNCSKEPTINKVIEYELAGICIKCPAERIDSILSAQNGILKVDYNPKKFIVRISIDSTIITEKQIINILNESGYDVGMNIATIVTYKSPCCEDLLENIAVSDSSASDTSNVTNGSVSPNKNVSSEDEEEESLEELLDEIPESPEERIAEKISDKTIDKEIDESLEGDVDMADKEVEKIMKEVEKSQEVIQDDEIDPKVDMEKAIQEALKKQQKQRKKKK